jgi:hypothetical protein
MHGAVATSGRREGERPEKLTLARNYRPFFEQAQDGITKNDNNDNFVTFTASGFIFGWRLLFL